MLCMSYVSEMLSTCEGFSSTTISLDLPCLWFSSGWRRRQLHLLAWHRNCSSLVGHDDRFHTIEKEVQTWPHKCSHGDAGRWRCVKLRSVGTPHPAAAQWGTGAGSCPAKGGNGTGHSLQPGIPQCALQPHTSNGWPLKFHLTPKLSTLEIKKTNLYFI